MPSGAAGVTWRLIKVAAGDGPSGSQTAPGAPLPAGPCGSDALALARGPAIGGYTHLVCEPASGGDPAILSAILSEAAALPDAVIVGCTGEAPGAAAAAGRLCLRLETGLHVPDPRSPYRAYPLAPMRRLAARRSWAMTDGEVMVNLAWGGVQVRVIGLPAHAGKGAAGGRSPGTFARHIRLLLRRLTPWPHPRLVDRPAESELDFRHPVRLFRQVLAEHAAPRDLAVSGFVGVFMGALPLLMCHTVAILYVTTRLRLNRAMAVATQNICAPPLVPALCIEVGYFLRNGTWLTEVSRRTLLLEAHQRLLEWLIGSLIAGPILGVATGAVIYFAGKGIERRARSGGAPARIDDRRRGNRLGYLSFHVALRLFGRRGAYGLLYIVALHYLVFDPAARRLALPYLSRRFPGHGGWRRAMDIYRLFYSQGVSLIDRYRMLATPQAFKQSTAHYELVQPLAADRSRGFVLLVSHVGNWQALMLALRRMNRNVTLLMRPEENPVAKEYLRFDGGSNAMRMVSPDLPMGGVIELTQRFREGDIIAIMGDRSYGAPTMPVEFMGDTARFPCGPFQLASAWECPVAVLFASRTGPDEYTVEIADVIRVSREGDRRENMRRAMQSYADLLQEFAARNPYQVYLFEDVWRLRPPDRNGT